MDRVWSPLREVATALRGVVSPLPWAGTVDHQTDHSPTLRSSTRYSMDRVNTLVGILGNLEQALHTQGAQAGPGAHAKHEDAPARDVLPAPQ